MMVTEEREGYVIRSKTGWVFSTEPQVGWWVGWVETPDDVVYFALNLDVLQPDHLAARTRIGRAILADLGVLPA
jgi:beta-lactamase class D